MRGFVLWFLRASAVTVMLGGLALFSGADRAEAALTSLTWTVSNTQTGATGVHYAWSFIKTTNTANVVCITFGVPTGTAGTPAIVATYGIVGSATVTLVGSELRLSITSQQITNNRAHYFEFSGLTNTSTAGTYSSLVSIRQTSCTTAASDSGTSNNVTFGSGSTSTIIAIARSTVFSSDATQVVLPLDPNVNNGLATSVINVGVTSNAASGYTIQCRVNAQPTGFTAKTTGMASAAAWNTAADANKFGYTLAVTNNGGSGSPAVGGSLSATNYAGFTTGGENCGTASGRTGNALGTDTGCGVGLCASAAHAWALTVAAQADNSTATGEVTNTTITLTVTPSY